MDKMMDVRGGTSHRDVYHPCRPQCVKGPEGANTHCNATWLHVNKNIIRSDGYRENPYATPWRLRGHTYVPWAPGTCNVIGRQIVWVAVEGLLQSLFPSFGGERMTATPIQTVSEVIL